jgi:hypothetical protein
MSTIIIIIIIIDIDHFVPCSNRGVGHGREIYFFTKRRSVIVVNVYSKEVPGTG